MTKRDEINARISDTDELLSYSAKDPFTGKVNAWGGTLLDADEDGDARGYRRVFIIAGTTTWAYGGPEEGGWYYDHFHDDFQVEVVVRSDQELLTVLAKVDELLTLVRGPEHTEIRVGGNDWPHFQRPHYE